MLEEARRRTHDRWNSRVVLVSQGGVEGDQFDGAFQDADIHDFCFECPKCKCTVTQATAGYQVTFDSTGDQALITATTDSLFPASSAYIYEATTGGVSTNEVQVVTLEVDNAACVELTDDIASPSATVTVVREGITRHTFSNGNAKLGKKKTDRATMKQ